MSDLYHKLGPQGRSLLNNPGRNPSLGVAYQSRSDTSTYTPQELDYVIHTLRYPKPELTINQVLGYLYNYIPYIKHELNLGLVFSSFLNSTTCFGGEGYPTASFEEMYPIIEVFKLIFDKKLKISQPTLSLKLFYSRIESEIENFVAFNPIANSWKVLPVICGISLSNTLRDELYSSSNFIKYRWFFQEWSSKMKRIFINCLQYSLSNTYTKDIIFLSVTSLALVFKKEENVKLYTNKIGNTFMVDALIDMMFLNQQVSTIVYQKFFHLNPQDPDLENNIQIEIMQKPVIKHLNRFSFLLAAYLSHLKYDEQMETLIDSLLLRVTQFNKELSQLCTLSIFNTFTSVKNSNSLFQLFWYFMKNLLFSEIIIFQGLFTRFLTGNNKSHMIWFNHRDLAIIDKEYRGIALKVLPNLYYLNFILLSIGQGGFDTYNFVYYLSIELSLSTGSYFEHLTMNLIGDYKEVNMYPDVLNNDYIMQAKVLFVLGLWENYLQLKNIHNEVFAKEIYNIAKSLANDRQYQNDDLIEASHSVLLFYFANSKNANLSDCIEYVNLLIQQFPKRISATQLCIAIETIGKKILSNPHQPSTPGSKFSNSAEEFFMFLADKCKPIQPGIRIGTPEENPNFASAQPIAEVEANSTLNTLEQDKRLDNDIIHDNKAKKPKDKVVRDLFPKFKKDYNYGQRLLPETAREAAVLALINLVPYFPVSRFTPWVEVIWSLIVKSNDVERDYLVGMLWKVFSDSLDLNRVELAMKWWYEDKQIPEKMQQLQIAHARL